MKAYVLCFSIFIVCSFTQAQTTPEALLAQLPAVPTVNCTAEREEIDHFSDLVHQVKTIIQQEVDRIHADAQAGMERDRDKIVSNAIRQSGLNKNDVSKLQQSDGSEKEMRKAAEKVISGQVGLSLQELEKVGNMSEAEQEKWAQNYANQKMDEAKKDPKAAMKQGDKPKRMMDLANEQKELNEYITERMNRIGVMFTAIAQTDSIESLKLEDQMRPLEAQLCSGICTDAEIARSKAAEKQIHALKVEFCQKMSPLQTDALEQYLTTVKSLLPSYRRLTVVQNELSSIQQLGEIVPDDLSCLAAIDQYADQLLSAYKYWVGKFEK